jgi:glutathione S-transferase
MKLYGHPLSGNTHRVQTLLSILGIEHEYEIVDLQSGAHKQPDFLKLNPLGQVPVLEDGDVILRDSTAILIYLARKFDTGQEWLPADATGAAQVQQWLSVSVNEIQAGPFVLRLVKLLGAPLDYDAALAKTQAVFGDLFEPHLKENTWLVGTQPSIADLACYSYIARVTEGDFDLGAYPAIQAWLVRVEAIKGFTPMAHAADLMRG